MDAYLPGLTGIVAESPQALQRRAEDLQRIARANARYMHDGDVPENLLKNGRR